jgi:tetratricopeptide (TPR) repeat protein
MLKRIDDKKFKELIKDFTEEELAQLEAYQVEKNDVQKMANYYRYAQNNINKDRLELAEIYLNRIVNQKINNEMKKSAAEQLIELYVIQERYSKAIEVYDFYLDANMTLKDVKNLYNKGTIYEKLNQITKSLKIFEEIAAKYPDTIWARKAQISIFKINNRKKNKL